MIGLIAGIGARAVLGKAAANAKRDVAAVGGWLSRRKPIELLTMVLAIALVVQYFVDHRYAAKLEKQLGKCSTALTNARAAFDQTVANYRAAAERARAADAANKTRVEGEQKAINERTDHAYQARIAAARALAERLRRQGATAEANPRGGPAAPVPGVPAASAGPAQATGQDGLPHSDKRARGDRGALGPEDALTATEQAIQLDELIKWVRAQHAVDPNGQQENGNGPDQR